jgi:glycosyltransferase involved in cell wall biosynthesis
MRIDFVVPRYGEAVVGGAELVARQTAEHLAVRPGFDVGVITTCALDARTWRDELPEGETVERGVRVRRFSAHGRSPDFDRVSGPLLATPERMTARQQSEWLRLQGPVSDQLIDAVRASDADLIEFTPYLFHPTVCGVPEARGRAVLHPAAHDEPVLRIPMYQDVFSSARAIVFNTHAEQRLVQSRFPVASVPQIVLGHGADEPVDAAPGPALAALDERPFLLCLGRIERAKGTDALAAQFVAYKARNPGPLTLVFAGPVVDAPVAGPDVVVAGLVDESTKAALLRDARALVSASTNESFGLVLLEAWMAGTPVIVNAACEATREHCERSSGGLWYANGAEFEVAVRRLVDDDDLCSALADAGARYARRFTWPGVVDRYVAFLRSVVQAR